MNLDGKKTYILVGAMLVVGILANAGLITDETYKSIMTILVPGGIATLRMGVGGKP